MTKQTQSSTSKRLGLVVPMGVAALVLYLTIGWTWGLRAKAAGAEHTTSAAPATNAAPGGALPPMPVVSRPAASQPLPGLPADTHLDKTPPRNTVGLDLLRNGWTYNCMECHKLFPARWHYDRALNEHKDIKLEHGNNRFCLNCHHSTNRTAFVDYDGAEIPESDVVLLCAKCHGPTYRDWQAGVHGRQNGYWNTSMGSRTKLRCIQCHDPHKPKFQPVKPLAPLRYPARAANSSTATATTPADAKGHHSTSHE